VLFGAAVIGMLSVSGTIVVAGDLAECWLYEVGPGVSRPHPISMAGRSIKQNAWKPTANIEQKSESHMVT
jgi:hypothetical protein